MIEFFARNFCLLFLSLAFFQLGEAQSTFAIDRIDETILQKSSASDDDKGKNAVAETTRIVAAIVADSYPELDGATISVKTFRSRSDYFRSQFSVSRFLTFRKLHFIIFVNPQVFEKNAPADGIRAIVAHELAHAVYYQRHNRFELFGLMSLASRSFTARFERGADLQAIKRGYGAGLKDYREWLYRNITAEKIKAKKRDYFSPEEIDSIVEAVKKQPHIIDFWIKNVPRNQAQIESAIISQSPDGK